MEKVIALFIHLFLLTAFGQESPKINNNGLKLLNYYLSLNVKNLWKSGSHVDWETGLPNDPESEKLSTLILDRILLTLYKNF
jgi:hypothetical protein